MKNLHNKNEVPRLWEILFYILLGVCKNIFILFGVSIFAYILIEIFKK